MLEDIAVLTGGTVISEEVGLSLEKAEWLNWVLRKSTNHQRKHHYHWRRWFWRANQGPCCTNSHTADEATSDYDKEKLQERLAKLARCCCDQSRRGTEIEMKEKKAALKMLCIQHAQLLKKA